MKPHICSLARNGPRFYYARGRTYTTSVLGCFDCLPETQRCHIFSTSILDTLREIHCGYLWENRRPGRNRCRKVAGSECKFWKCRTNGKRLYESCHRRMPLRRHHTRILNVGINRDFVANLFEQLIATGEAESYFASSDGQRPFNVWQQKANNLAKASDCCPVFTGRTTPTSTSPESHFSSTVRTPEQHWTRWISIRFHRQSAVSAPMINPTVCMGKSKVIH